MNNKQLLKENLTLIKEIKKITDCESVVSEEKFFKDLETIKKNLDIITNNIDKITDNIQNKKQQQI